MLQTIAKISTTLILVVLCLAFSSPEEFLYSLKKEQNLTHRVVDKMYLAKHNKNVVDNFGGIVENAEAAINSAELEYTLDIGPITASTSANYVYTSIYNPIGSGRTMSIKRLAIRANTASSTASNYVNLTTRRISTASGGTQISATNIPKKNTSSSNTIGEIRYNGPSVTLSGTVDSRIMGQPLSGAVGSRFSIRDISFGTNDEKLVLQPGEGIAVYQEAAGAMATRVYVTVEWDETSNAPAPEDEFLFAFPRVENAAGTNYVYNSFFNPASSGKTAVIKRIWFGAETCDTTAVYTNNIVLRRITAASAGTSISATNIPKKNTNSQDSVMEFRRTGVTVATSSGQTLDARLGNVTPCAAAGEAVGWQMIDFEDNDEKFILQEGEGVALMSDTAGDVDQLVRMIIEWEEITSTPTAAGEYMWASSRVESASAANTTHYSFFNPSGSGKTVIIKRLSTRINAETAATYVPFSWRRLTAASGGTLIAAADLSKKNTDSTNSVIQVRWCGAACASAITATYSGTTDARLLSVTTPGAVSQTIGVRDITFGNNEQIILQPGEGIGLYNETLVDVDEYVKVSCEWEEVASTPTSQGQYLMDIGPVNGTTSLSMNFVTFFNPANSGKYATIKRAEIRADTIAVGVYIPVQLRRITATNLGTLIASSSYPKLHTGTATSTMIIRLGSATTSTTYFGTVDSKILGVQTPGAVASVLTDNIGYKSIVFDPNEGIVLAPGEGVALYHESFAGDADQRVRLLLQWQEEVGAPTALNEFHMSTGPITQAAAANYVYSTFFNPANSAKNYLVKRLGIRVNRVGAATNPTYGAVTLRRLTAASAGTLVATTSLTRKNSSTSTSTAEVRTTNVTASFSGNADSRILGVTTPGVVNQGSGEYESEITFGDELILQPGEGLGLYQESATADTNARYRLEFEWEERSNAAPPQVITFSVSTSTVYLGVVSSVQTRYASSTNPLGSSVEEEAHTFSVLTNATNGYTVTAKGGTLANGSTTIVAIGGTNTLPSVGTEQFGIRLTATGGSGTTTPPYGAPGFAYAATATTSSQVASASTGDNATTTFSVRYMTNISSLTNPGSYTASIVYVATANF